MRNLKRILSLALAVVMVIGMMVMTTGAADYADADEISRNEAVDVMSALKVLEGDGTNFHPGDILTREEATTIITKMLMGPEQAKLLTGTTAFTDVEADRWSAPYIGYCASLNILAGNGDGTFDPEGKLTGVAFAKMLLVALGYDPAIEGYLGDNWSTNIGSDAIEVGLNITGVSLDDDVTRENAAQMALQAMTKPLVKYAQKGTAITINGVDIVTGASEAEARTWGTTDVADRVDYNGGDDELNSTDTVQFCEKYFSGLSQDWTPANGVTGYAWKIAGKTAPASDFIVCESILATSTDGTAIYSAAQPCLTRKDTTNPKFKAELDTGYTVWVNGAPVPAYADGATLESGTIDAGDTYFNTTVGKFMAADANDTISSDDDDDSVDINGKGVKVELINVDRDAKAEKIYFTTYVLETLAEAPETKTSTVDGKEYIYIDMGSDLGASNFFGAGAVEAADVFGYEDLAKGDIVTIIAMADGTYHFTKVVPVVAQATAIKGTTLTIGGKEVDPAAVADTSFSSYTEGYNVDVNFYYDAYGYGLYAEVVEEVLSDHVVVLSYVKNAATGGYAGAAASYQANLLFRDGTTEIVTLASGAIGETDITGATAGTINSVADGALRFYTYSVNKAGKYTLTAAAAPYSNVAVSAATVKTGVADVDTGVVANSKTTFVVRTATGNPANPYVYTVYSGIANAPGLTSAAGYALVKNGAAELIYISTSTQPPVDTSTKNVYLMNLGELTYVGANAAAGTDAYYLVDAIVAGAKTTFMIEEGMVSGGYIQIEDDGTIGTEDADDLDTAGLYNVTVTDGYVTNVVAVSSSDTTNTTLFSGVAIKAASNDVIKIDTTSYTYAEDAVVYIIDSTKKTVETTTIEAVEDAASASGVIVLADRDADDAKKTTITALYIVE